MLITARKPYIPPWWRFARCPFFDARCPLTLARRKLRSKLVGGALQHAWCVCMSTAVQTRADTCNCKHYGVVTYHCDLQTVAIVVAINQPAIIVISRRMLVAINVTRCSQRTAFPAGVRHETLGKPYNISAVARNPLYFCWRAHAMRRSNSTPQQLISGCP